MTERASDTIVVIEDDNTMREGIRTVLEKQGYRVFTASSAEEGWIHCQERTPRMVITDLKLPGKSGIDLLEEIRRTSATTAVVLISAYGTIDLAVEALKKGAKDFIAKPFTIDELRMKVEQILDGLAPVITDQIHGGYNVFHEMVGNSEAITELFHKITEVAAVESPVLITGESGTGKELMARAIHAESKRSDRPLLAVNCGALSESLLESELFGHEEGAFTGAVRQHKGVFERANRGTILLDEVGEISRRMQVKLLRVLQQKTFHRVGGWKELRTDVRLLASTNMDLKAAIQNKEFREDLYFRLNVIPLHVPALRERTGDIPVLTLYLTEKKSQELDKQKPVWSEGAIEKLQQYSWPGNIRELENFLERLLIFNRKETITDEDIYFEEAEDTFGGSSGGTLTDVLEDTEYHMIVDALRKSGGIKQQAARMLGLKVSTLYYKMEKYGIDKNGEGKE
ncbi:MAG TPA: sigma-54 dependent transcriptional regulator [bacterium]|nr:sigma-54 dependent transcriptional regulator [bacterium]